MRVITRNAIHTAYMSIGASRCAPVTQQSVAVAIQSLVADEDLRAYPGTSIMHDVASGIRLETDRFLTEREWP